MWGNTYISNLRLLITLQKKAVRIMTSSDFYAHSGPLFKKLGTMKVIDLVYYRNALFMHGYSNSNLPNAFSVFLYKSVQIKSTVIILDQLRNKVISFLKLKQIMENFLSDTKVKKHGIPSMMNTNTF